MSGVRGYTIYLAIFVFFFATLASLGFYDMPSFSSVISSISEKQFTGAAITGAVVSVVQEPGMEKEHFPLMSWAIILISFSFLFSLITVRSVHKRSKYRA